jgi:hypothetical protein
MIIIEEKNDKKNGVEEKTSQSKISLLMILSFVAVLIWLKISYDGQKPERVYVASEKQEEIKKEPVPPPVLLLDKDLYDKKLLALAHRTIATTTQATSSTATSTKVIKYLWPTKTVYPNYGALLPFNRIIAYYGNFYSKQMGVLGEYAPEVMVAKLNAEVERWRQADPSTPVIPAIHYIAAVAQASAGDDGDYLARMPYSEIDKAISLGDQVHGVVFLDIQIGHSTVASEVNALAKYLALPQVHLGIDPEFAMKDGRKPGTVIGTLDAADINQAAQILAKIVRDNNLPPKILIVHRFTEDMVTNYQNIKPLPEVQIIMTMDGWGSPDLKKGTYNTVIYPEPVQFTGFKLFYKNDLRKPSTRMLTPEEILHLTPSPSYIQYQ